MKTGRYLAILLVLSLLLCGTAAAGTASTTLKTVVPERNGGGAVGGGAVGGAVNQGCPKDKTCPLWSFRDTDPTAWYHDGVHYCLDNDIMQGYSRKEFGPNDVTTRGQLVVILYRLAGSPAVGNRQSFGDVPAKSWFSTAVQWASACGIVKGYGNGKFGPNDTVTREQLVAIMYRYARGGIPKKDIGDFGFSDAEKVSVWAQQPMCWALGKGIINGISATTLSPQGNASRAQIATMIWRNYGK